MKRQELEIKLRELEEMLQDARALQATGDEHWEMAVVRMQLEKEAAAVKIQIRLQT